jgi:predicted unusual protein kinase regulating ubiquinone biosynthesis (AarF/ABC1/UbiB family)
MNLKPAHLKRYASVTRLLIKYGRGRTGRSLVSSLDSPTTDEPVTEANGQELAKDLESLGPTFIKLGQLLSSRANLIPPGYATALERLQDSVEPFPFDDVERIVTDELGLRISKGFEHFEPRPLASASLGQVHRARLRDGREVVVKVQRPGIRQRILEDLESFDQMAHLLDRHTAVGDRMDLEAVLEEFRKTILEELDYRREARNLERLATNLAEFERIVVPRPVPDYTSTRVLTMDYIEGKKITGVNPVVLLEADGSVLAEELFQAYLKQILIDGFFHADPHPGNVFLTPDNRIALLDLGMVDRLPPGLQDSLLRLLLAIADGRGEDAADYALAIAERQEQAGAADRRDERGFRRRVADMVAEYSGSGLVDLPVGRAFLEMVRAAGETGVRLPPETTLLGKALFNLDAIGRSLAPDFDPTESIRRNTIRLLRKRVLTSFSPGSLAGSALELREFAARLPARINRILDAATTNQLGLRLDTGLNPSELMVGFQKIANRITTGLVIAALIVGAAMLMQVDTRFRILGYPGFAILLFLFAAGAGIILLVRILTRDEPDRRQNRKR